MNEQEVNKYYALNGKIKELKDNIQSKRDEFEKSIVEESEEMGRLSLESMEIKDSIMVVAKEEFGSTGNKKMYGGIGIRETTRLNYEDIDAIKWARTNMPIAIKEVIDKKQFETFAKVNELDFVYPEKNITVTFPKVMR